MFDKYFEVFLADSEESKQLHYKIRYQVYCEEMGFEDKDNFPLEQESDKWDQDAVHFLLRHKYTGQWAGAMRLVFRNGSSLPMEELCSVKELDENEQIYSKTFVELSRLCLLKDVRRSVVAQKIESFDTQKNGTEHKVEASNVKLFSSHRKMKQSTLFGLVYSAALYSIENGIKDWYWLGTDALGKVLEKKGLKVFNIGDPCEHRGLRFPCKVYPGQALSALSADYQQPYFLYSQLEAMEEAATNVA